MIRFAAFAFLLLFGLLGSARAQFGGGEQMAKPSLVAEVDAVVPGKPLTVLVRFEMKPGWHVYWQFGGDAGAPPRVEWELPPGFKAGDIQWPLPVSYKDEGDLVTYIYPDEVSLPVEIATPANVSASEVTLKAKLSWLVCEKICLPGRGEVSLKLPVAAASQPANAELFAKAEAKLPQNSPPPFRAKWNVQPGEFSVEVEGLPQEARIEFFPLPPEASVRPGVAQIGEPAATGVRSIRVAVKEGGTASTAWRGLLVAQLGEGPRQGWMISPAGQVSAPGASSADRAAASAATTAPTGGVSQSFAGALSGRIQSVWAALAVAFVGGLILNLMPCVLPVITLKIFNFVSQAGEHPDRVFRLGLAFVAGVFVFFLGIAGLAIGLRAAGQGFFWGMQFADPKLLLALVALVVLFALSMFGLFEITLGGSAENALGSLARKEGYAGAFVHGLFTTLLGTSCTAPFVGPVLGFAVTQPPAAIVAIFLSMAAGMALPYFLLTWRPAWMRFLPKPGVWMERFKQLMGFVLLAVAVWLLGVFGKTRGADAASSAAWLMLFLALACWIFGASGRRWWAAILSLIVLAVGARIFLPDALHQSKTAGAVVETKPNAVGIVWEKFSPDRVEQARQAGRAVFLDFTAEWCVNCKVNERAVLNTAPIAALFKEKNVLTLKADWTDFDPVISEWLKKFQRIGVPLYVLYRPGEDAPVLLPELLTTNLVLSELAKIQR
jgi:thiol:disulfide interchange protein DsbD